MNTLIIDTASDMEIAILSAGGKSHAVAGIARESHAVTLFTSIHRCMESLSVSIRDVELMAAGTGPGSFTGVRIAVATARMIAQILRIPLVGIPSQEIYARSLRAKPGEQVLVAFDAKKGKVFGAVYLMEDKGGLTVLAPPGDYTMEDLCRRARPDRPAVTAGNGVVRYPDAVESLPAGHRHCDTLIPDASILANCIIRKYRESPEFYRNCMNTIPLYGRKSDAELMKESGK